MLGRSRFRLVWSRSAGLCVVCSLPSLGRLTSLRVVSYARLKPRQILMSVLLNNLPLCPQTDQTALQPRVSVSTSRNRMDRGHALSRLGVCIVQLSPSMAAELHSTRRSGGLARCHLANRSISWAWAWSQRSHGGPPSSSSTIHFYGTVRPLFSSSSSSSCPSSIEH